LAIYTCLDMIRDCRANAPAGWSYFVQTYLPVTRWLLDHYQQHKRPLETVLSELHSPALPLWAAPGPMTERDFVVQLRLQIIPDPRVEGNPLDLEILSTAFEPLTAIERQFVWFDTMGYDTQKTATVINVEQATVEGARTRAEEMLRGAMDNWTRGLLRTHGWALGHAARGTKTEACFPHLAFLDVIDGRITWSRKKDIEFHLMKCWYCVDHFCRIREADYALHAVKPLPPEDVQRYRKLLKLPEEKKPLLARLFGN
jgi:hypothetical protein